jgi:hypothetical protein
MTPAITIWHDICHGRSTRDGEQLLASPPAVSGLRKISSTFGPSLGKLIWIDAETEYCGRRRS